MSPAQHGGIPPHSSHPNFGHLTLLVFEAVMEVVCVSLPGYIVARRGLFSEEMQKFIAYLNILLFTPCLIFTKLGSQLSADKLADLAVIPVIYLLQVGISYLSSILVAKVFGFKSRARNFVIAMGVFGNSNSLPISLVLSLSQTIRGLHWDKIPGDNDDEVGARGILYLLIFQQLGQLLRWSWGMNVLLKKSEEDEETTQGVDSRLERGQGPSSDPIADGYQPLTGDSPSQTDQDTRNVGKGRDETIAAERHYGHESTSSSRSDQPCESGEQTPVTSRQYTSSISSEGISENKPAYQGPSNGLLATPANGNILSSGEFTSTNKASARQATDSSNDNLGPKGQWKPVALCQRSLNRGVAALSRSISTTFASIFNALPSVIQKSLVKLHAVLRKVSSALSQSINPPLVAMGAALIVASIPSLQRLFFSDGTFVKNSVTSAIRQTGGVAVPLILVVLGANLARGSHREGYSKPSDEESKEETKLLIASLLCRMVLPTALMVPILAIGAKYVPISILDDPIFVIVCFLLAGAPSALQLAQICQVNEVYMGAMTRILFHSYVIWILPSTLILVMCALEVVEWAA
ncbi:hypothetical protein MMC07_007428 [Pseudocyphellaria aurata]|nr:hypothetical protein [Pseudocyphellaria aurata]